MPALGEVSEPVNRDSDVLLGNFCNVMVDVMPGSITYKLGFQALLEMISNCCCLVTQSCPTLCNFKDCSMPGSLSFSISWSSLKSMSIESVMPSNHLTLCCPLLLLPLIFSSIRVLSNVLALHIRQTKYWNFSFSLSPSNEYSGLISFRIDWFDLLAVLDKGMANHSSILASGTP